ncbi:23S rRNA (adenine(2503)-C(2))-methyltransferase RlmN [soil metagenome]
MPSRYDIDPEQLAGLLVDEPAYRARQVWDGLYRRAVDPEDLTELPKDLRARLGELLPAALRPVTETVSGDGETVKWLWELDGGTRVETVLMHYPDRHAPGAEPGPPAPEARHGRSTVCVSTQAGCAMGCGFCATGQAGFVRQLSTGEIVEQVVRAIRRARPRRVSNVVFMGMGEPLANYDNTWAAVERIHGDIGLSDRHLTISTVGVVPGIKRLAGEHLPVNLAVSLHAANDALRNDLVPINRRYPLAVLVDACAAYVAASGRRLSFEWAMIDGVNDRVSDARELAQLARRLRAHVNLIPLNPTPGYATRKTPADGVRAFRDRLALLGVNATVRRNRGTDIDAACGQLHQRSAGLAVGMKPGAGRSGR